MKTQILVFGLVGVFWITNLPAKTYQVGPTRSYPELGSVTSLLLPGDVVEVDGDTTYPGNIRFYHGGTAESPVTVRGIRINGRRPILTGATITNLANVVSFRTDHVVFEGFEIDGTMNPLIVRGVYNVGDQNTVRDTLVHDCAQHGIHGSDISGSFTLDNVEVHHCGGYTLLHQIYINTDNVNYPDAVFRMQFCYVHDANGGNNVKSRASRNEIYYNWIEGAYYHELDLIGADRSAQAPGTADLVREDSDVVGNVIVKLPETQGQVARLGDDGSGSSNGRYRFAYNTIMVHEGYAWELFKVTGPRQSVELHNNVFARISGTNGLSLMRGSNPGLGPTDGFYGYNNWMLAGTIMVPPGLQNTLTGPDPHLANAAALDFSLTNGSALLNAALSPTPSPPDFPFINPLQTPQFLPPLRSPLGENPPTPRADAGEPDIGAFGSVALAPGILTQPASPTIVQGQSAVLAVAASGSLMDVSPLQYQWLHDGTPVPDATGTSLAFPAALTNDTGVYVVVIANAFGSVTSAPATFTVNRDRFRPVVTISAPTGKTPLTSGLVALTGTVTDDACVGGILVNNFNPDAWLPVTTVCQTNPAFARWTNMVQLQPGTNILCVKAVDFSGNEAFPVTRTLFYSQRSPLTLQTSGSGLIAPAVLNGAPLELTKNYSVIATPAANNLFSNWLASVDGGPATVVSTVPKYTFTMQSNLVLTAQFVPNGFIAVAGSYNGLFSETGAVAVASAGFFTVTTSARQTFSGKLSFAGEVEGFSGGFDVAGNGITSKPVPLRNQPGTLTVRLQLPFDGSATISGLVSNNTSGWVAPLFGDRAGFNVVSNPATAYAGIYTLVIPGATNAAEAPGGDGYGTVSIGSNGLVSFVGGFGDGETMAQTVSLSRNGDWPLFGKSKSGREMILGWLSVSNSGAVVEAAAVQPAVVIQPTPPAGQDIGGGTSWVKAPTPTDAFYPAGFALAPEVVGARYTAPAANALALGWTNGVLLLADGNLSGALSNNVRLSTLNKFIMPTNYALKLALTLKSGKLTGSFKHPDRGNVVTPMAGVILQGVDIGCGVFRGTNQSGAFRLQGNPPAGN